MCFLWWIFFESVRNQIENFHSEVLETNRSVSLVLCPSVVVGDFIEKMIFVY